MAKDRARDRDTDRSWALHRLAGEIAAALERGVPQDQATLDTVLATLGQADAHAALALLAADPEASEHAPLVALLFSPGPTLLRGLEPALARADVDAQEALAVAERVVQRVAALLGPLPALLPALLPEGTRAGLRASAEGLRAFVRRLSPQATAPAELRALLARRCGPEPEGGPEGGLDRGLAGELAVDLAVLLRHCRLVWTPERVFFIATLLERAELGTDDLPGLLAWATGFLDLGGWPLGLRRALAGRRQALLAQLQQAEFLEQALARGSYETLMAQGLRLAHVHGPEVRAELGHLERAAVLVLGLPGAALDGVNVCDLGLAEDMDALLRLFPGPEDACGRG
jgi:hypothetical protein